MSSDSTILTSFINDAQNDIETWRQEDSIVDTVRKLLEIVVGLGLFARAIIHTVIYVATAKDPVSPPDVDLSLRFAPVVDEEMTFSDELCLRLVTAGYGYMFVVWPPILRWGLPPNVQVMLRSLALLNLLVLLLDPLWIIPNRILRS